MRRAAPQGIAYKYNYFIFCFHCIFLGVVESADGENDRDDENNRGWWYEEKREGDCKEEMRDGRGGRVTCSSMPRTLFVVSKLSSHRGSAWLWELLVVRRREKGDRKWGFYTSFPGGITVCMNREADIKEKTLIPV